MAVNDQPLRDLGQFDTALSSFNLDLNFLHSVRLLVVSVPCTRSRCHRLLSGPRHARVSTNEWIPFQEKVLRLLFEVQCCY